MCLKEAVWRRKAQLPNSKILRTAAVYQHFLDNIEPSEWIYHEEDVRPALEIAARLAAHDSRR